MTPSDLTGLPDNILRKMVEEARAEAARQALLVQRYEPAYLGLPHVVRERDEARAEVARLEEVVEDARSYAAEIAQGVSHYPHEEAEPCVRCRAERAEAEVARLQGSIASYQAAAHNYVNEHAEVARLEGLILYCDTPGSVIQNAMALVAEAKRIRAKREKGEARTTCRHGVQWPDFCQFNCAIGKPAQREKEK